MSVAPTAVQVQEAWNLVHPHGSGCYTGIDVERCASRRGWELLCACGRFGFVEEGCDGDLVVQKHLPDGTVTDVRVPRDPSAAFFLRERRQVYGTWTANRVVIRETTGTRRPFHPCDAMAAMSNVMRCVDQALTCKAFVKLDVHISRGFLQSLYLRIEKSMGEMVERVLRPDSTLSSDEWSRRVREGVKALPKPGPVVMCQSEED